MGKKKGMGEKRCVARHRRMSAENADKAERYWERLTRREGKREIAEQLAEVTDG